MKRGVNSTEMQKSNRVLVFTSMLLSSGGISRTDLALQSGLQKGTITNIINEFSDMGIVAVEGDSASGRRAEKLVLKLDGIYILSMGITRKDYQVSIYTLDGRQMDHCRYEEKKGEDLSRVLRSMADEAVRLQQKYGDDKIIGVVLAVPGPYMKKRTTGEEVFDVVEFPGFNNAGIREMMEKALGRPIEMVHDAKLSAYAEWHNAQEAREDPNMSLVVIRSRGYGIGAGIVINQKVVEGQMGVAGEIGYTGINYNGRSGISRSFESCAGTESAVRYMLSRLYEFPDTVLNENSTYTDVLAAYRDGDELARWAVLKMGWMLAYGITNLIYTINPDCIILGPDYPDLPEFIDYLKETLKSMAHPRLVENMIIRSSTLMDDSFLLGGYYYMVEKIIQEDDFFPRIRQIRSLENKTDTYVCERDRAQM